MMSTSNKKRDYVVAKILHWVVAFIAVLLLMSGWKAPSLELEDKIVFIMIHSGLGTLLFALMFFRWWWRRNHKLYISSGWYKNPLMLLQWLFYPLLVLQPVLGILQAAFNEYNVRAFGLINYSALAVENKYMFTFFHTLHIYTAILLILIIFIHILDKSRRFFIEDSKYSTIPGQNK